MENIENSNITTDKQSMHVNNVKLRKFQEEGVEWMINKLSSKYDGGVLLADEMGLGKTCQVITVLNRFISKDREIGKTNLAVIVVPKSVQNVWIKEFSIFAPQLVVTAYQDKDTNINLDTNVLLITYDKLRNNYKQINKLNVYYFILDEAQKINNPISSQTLAVMNIECKKRIAITGTPIENTKKDITVIMSFVHHSFGNKNYIKWILANREKLNKIIAVNGNSTNSQYSRQKAKLDKLCNLYLDKVDLVYQYLFKYRYRTIYPFMLRRVMGEDTVKLPSLIKHIIFCTPTKNETAALDIAVCANYFTRLKKNAEEYGNEIKQLPEMLFDAPNINKIILYNSISPFPRYKYQSKDKELMNNELSTHLDQESYTAKIMVALKLIQDIIINKREKVVIFVRSLKVLAYLKKKLKENGIIAATIKGCHSIEQRKTVVENFQEKDNYNALLISIKCGGVGITLTKANHVILYDSWWNNAVLDQATARCYRFGQQNIVNEYMLVTQPATELLLPYKEVVNVFCEIFYNNSLLYYYEGNIGEKLTKGTCRARSIEVENLIRIIKKQNMIDEIMEEYSSTCTGEHKENLDKERNARKLKYFHFSETL